MTGTVGEYWHDGDGKRVKKFVPAVGENPAEVTIFVYDAAGKLVAEYSTIVADTNTAKVAYLTNDHLGSPRINTDKNGNVTARHDYHPFGEEISTSQRTVGQGYADDRVRKQFTGYERDGETELDFAQARMFAFGHGRFTSPDPYKIVAEVQAERDEEKARRLLHRYISQPQQWNAYPYAINNPLKYTDPSGETITLTGDTEEERAKALQRLRNILGEERFKLVTVSADGKTVSLSNENVAKFQKIGDDAENKDFSLGFAEILNSSQTVEFKVVEKVTLPDSTNIDLNTTKTPAAVTASGKDSSTGNIQIFVHPKAGEIMTKACEMRGDCSNKITRNTGPLSATNEVVDAHEFGHAWDRMRGSGPPAVGAKPSISQPGWQTFENAIRSRNPQNSQRRTEH